MAEDKKTSDNVKDIVSAALLALLGGSAVSGGSSFTGPSFAGMGSLGSLMGGIRSLSGSAGLPSMNGGVGEDAVKNAMGSASGGFVPFLVPVSTGASLTHNLVGKETPQGGAHEQTLAEHTQHMRELIDEYYSKNRLPPGLTGAALAAARNMQARKALEFAVREEPNRNFGYITQDMDGVKADTRPRTVKGRTFNASSSWVGAVRRTSPTTVDVYLGPSNNNESGWYSYGGSAKQVEDFLTGDSLGREIGAIRHGGGHTLKKLY